MSKMLKIIQKHPLLTAVILNSCFLLAAFIFCDPKYETADDFIEDAILSGSMSGTPDAHLLYSNIILGYLLKGLYTVIPSVSFYFFFLIILGFCAITAALWLILSNCKKDNDVLMGILMCSIFLVFFTKDIYVLPQFTKAAAIACTVGGLVFLKGIWDKDGKNIIRIICGIVLTLGGCMLRMNVIYLSLPFLFISFCNRYYMYVKSNDDPKNKYAIEILKRVACCILLIALAYLMLFLNNCIWDKDPDYARFRRMEPSRYEITDAPYTNNFEDIKPEMDSIGVSFNDYIMMKTWSFVDSEIFNEEKLQDFISIQNRYSSSKPSGLKDIADDFADLDLLDYSIVWGLVILAAAYCIFSRKSVVFSVATVLLSLALIVAMIMYGRINYRVIGGIILGAACTLCTIPAQPRNFKLKDEHYRILMGFVAACTIISNVGFYIPDSSYLTMNDDAYFTYVWNTMGNSGGYNSHKFGINVSRRRACEELLSTIEKDSGSFYLVDFNTFWFVMPYNYDPKARIPEGYFEENYYIIGGITMMQFPGQNALLEHNGISKDTPYKDLVKDNIYLIDNYFYDNKLEFIREHYYKDAQMELVDEVNGFKIWKISLPQNAYKE